MRFKNCGHQNYFCFSLPQLLFSFTIMTVFKLFFSKGSWNNLNHSISGFSIYWILKRIIWIINLLLSETHAIKNDQQLIPVRIWWILHWIQKKNLGTTSMHIWFLNPIWLFIIEFQNVAVQQCFKYWIMWKPRIISQSSIRSNPIYRWVMFHGLKLL